MKQNHEEDIEWIIRHVKSGDYQFRRHAAERASERGINPLDVKEALLNGGIIENYPDDPGCEKHEML